MRFQKRMSITAVLVVGLCGAFFAGKAFGAGAAPEGYAGATVSTGIVVNDPCLRYSDDKLSTRCCKLGFDETVDKEEFGCCRKYFDNTLIRGAKALLPYESLATKDAVAADYSAISHIYLPIYLLPKDLYKWIYQRCMNHCEPPREPPPFACGNVFTDAGKLACCEDLRKADKLGSNPLAALMKLCMAPEECSNTSIINIGAGATVTGNINVAQCCQIVNMVDSTAGDISNNCPIIPPGTPGPGPSTGDTTPSGSPAGPVACSCTSGGIAIGADKQPTQFTCTPSGFSPGASLIVSVSGDGKVVPPKDVVPSSDNKSMTLPTNGPFQIASTFELVGDMRNATGHMTANVTITDGANTATCGAASDLRAEGHGSNNGGGCSLIRE